LLVLRHGATEARLLPDLGGTLASLRIGDVDIVRPSPEGATDPLDTGCFPLVPYVNRIAHGRFAWAGGHHRLPRNFGDHPHSLHGIGWQRPWRVEAVGEDRATMVFDHDGGEGWPWPFHAEQQAVVADGSLTLTLSLTNLADAEVPAGLGFHPYLPASADTRLRFTAGRLWLADGECLPTEPAAAEAMGNWNAGAGVAGETLIDNSYEGWDGLATIETEAMRVRVTATGASWLHLFRPPGRDFFCVEPMTHMPDAINRGAGFDRLAPGATLAIAMTIAAER
jgi:aldose 1-epimerase